MKKFLLGAVLTPAALVLSAGFALTVGQVANMLFFLHGDGLHNSAAYALSITGIAFVIVSIYNLSMLFAKLGGK